MLIKISFYLFLLFLILGTILACSSSSWFLIWLGLEINLIRFIPLLINKLQPFSIEIRIKYFLIQAIASILIIFTSIRSEFIFYSNSITLNRFILTLAFSIKAGVAPLHFWFPQIIEFANWTQALLILTWQKIAPLILISFCWNTVVFFVILITSFTGILGGFNQICLKKILTYSSILHSAWLISISLLNISIWWVYFLRYSFIVTSIIISAHILNIQFINSFNQLKINYTEKILISLNFLSIAGLPPFLGFFIKIISINLILENSYNFFIITTLILSSLLAFFFYSRIIYSSFIINESNSKIMFNQNSYISFNANFLTIALTTNLFITTLVCLF